jgi:hypothetical protein
MKMYPHPKGKYINPQRVTCCYVDQIDKNIFQSVFEFGDDYKILCSHGTFDEANQDVLAFVEFCQKA